METLEINGHKFHIYHLRRADKWHAHEVRDIEDWGHAAAGTAWGATERRVSLRVRHDVVVATSKYRPTRAEVVDWARERAVTA